MDVLLANPRGFCAGVDRAIEIVDRLLDAFGAPIYVRHEVVHNRFVVEGLRKRGAIFVDELHEVPDGSTVVFSAHGVSQAVRSEGGKRGLQVYDATCPLVTKVHIEVAQHCRTGRDVLMIGHAGHPEVEGTLGQWDSNNPQGATIHLIETVEDARCIEIRDPDKLGFVTQTTLSVDDTRDIIAALQSRFPTIAGPRRDDICYATQNRQDAVRRLAEQCDLVLVVGSPNSSNSNRLRELSEKVGVPSHLIDGAQDVRAEWLDGKSRIGLTAGASAPESLVLDVVERLRSLGAASVRELDGKPEDIVFALPKELRVRLA